jgi:hypothetical protein
MIGSSTDSRTSPSGSAGPGLHGRSRFAGIAVTVTGCVAQQADSSSGNGNIAHRRRALERSGQRSREAGL